MLKKPYGKNWHDEAAFVVQKEKEIRTHVQDFAHSYELKGFFWKKNEFYVIHISIDGVGVHWFCENLK